MFKSIKISPMFFALVLSTKRMDTMAENFRTSSWRYMVDTGVKIDP
jgi:hypothetical protein